MTMVSTSRPEPKHLDAAKVCRRPSWLRAAHSPVTGIDFAQESGNLAASLRLARGPFVTLAFATKGRPDLGETAHLRDTRREERHEASDS